MTLHITRLSKSFVLQVSDRLVSGGQTDPLANKNIIYFASDAVVSIGFTGLAYGISATNPNMPTDEWIAGVLWGREIQRGPDGITPATFAVSNITQRLDIGQSIELLRKRLQESMEHLPQRYNNDPFGVVIAGWQEGRRTIVPILVEISKPHGRTEVSVDRRLERNWHIEGRIMASETPSVYLLEADREKFRRSFPAADAGESESLIVETTRGVSARHPNKVGPHCMSILLQPPNTIRARFIPSFEHYAEYANEAGIVGPRFPVAYSPWIIGPKGFLAPAVLVNSWEADVGGPLKVVIEGPPPDDGRSYFGSQRRLAPY